MAQRDGDPLQIAGACAEGSDAQKGGVLDTLTELFLVSHDRLTPEEADRLGEVMAELVYELDVDSRRAIADRLAHIPNAPRNLMVKLAHDRAAVAQPVLERSKSLAPNDLIEIAKALSQQHLLAMSNRDRLESAVTDVLVRRGGKNVLVSVTRNPGAEFSESGFQVLSNRAYEAPELKEALISRPDIPPDLAEKVAAIKPVKPEEDIVEFADSVAAEPFWAAIDAQDSQAETSEEASTRKTKEQTPSEDDTSFDGAPAPAAVSKETSSWSEFDAGEPVSEVQVNGAKLPSLEAWDELEDEEEVLHRRKDAVNESSLLNAARARDYRLTVEHLSLLSGHPKEQIEAHLRTGNVRWIYRVCKKMRCSNLTREAIMELSAAIVRTSPRSASTRVTR